MSNCGAPERFGRCTNSDHDCVVIVAQPLSVSTGFVYHRELCQPSRQLDVIVYDSSEHAPLYKNRDFVVIPSEALISAAEIKKALTLRHVREHIRNTVNFPFGMHAPVIPGVKDINLFAYSSACKTRRIAQCMADELSEHIQKFNMTTVAGHEAVLAARYISLPCVYLFDRGEFIETKIHKTHEPSMYSIAVTVFRSAADEKDGLNEFLGAMLPPMLDLRPNLRSMPLRSEEYSLTVSQPIYLATRVSVRQLAERFPRDADSLRNLRAPSGVPFAALVPADIDWSAVSDLHTLTTLDGFEWLIAPLCTSETTA